MALRSLSPALMAAARAQPIDRARLRARLRIVFDQLGGTFTKFGQLIASAESMVGPELANAFRGTLDRAPAVPFEGVRHCIEAEFGSDLHDLYASFDPTPLVAGSIAVVHRGTLVDGTVVAVKVLRPGTEDLVGDRHGYRQADSHSSSPSDYPFWLALGVKLSRTGAGAQVRGGAGLAPKETPAG